MHNSSLTSSRSVVQLKANTLIGYGRMQVAKLWGLLLVGFQAKDYFCKLTFLLYALRFATDCLVYKLLSVQTQIGQIFSG